MELFLQQVLNGLMIGSTYAVVALGFSLVFSVMRVVNMAHPEFFMAGAFGAYLTIRHVTTNFFGVLAGRVRGAAGATLGVAGPGSGPRRGRDERSPVVGPAGGGSAQHHPHDA